MKAEQEFCQLLNEREKEYLSQLALTCIFIETKIEGVTVQDLTCILRDFGDPKIIKEHETGFWCNFSDISSEQTIHKIMV